MLGGICSKVVYVGDRYINSYNNTNSNNNSKGINNSNNDVNRQIWYNDENNLYGYPMMQKVPYKVFEYITTPLDYI